MATIPGTSCAAAPTLPAFTVDPSLRVRIRLPPMTDPETTVWASSVDSAEFSWFAHGDWPGFGRFRANVILRGSIWYSFQFTSDYSAFAQILASLIREAFAFPE